MVLAAAGIDRLLGREASASGAIDPLETMLGSSKEIIGDMMFLKADEYFHGGVIEKFSERPESTLQAGRIDSVQENHEPGDEVPEPPTDWIAGINARVRSHEHLHLSREKRKEMLPFFALSTALDPHHIEAILATAYWLETEFGKIDEAIQALKKGILDNPGSWQLEDHLAGIYFNAKKDYPESEKHYREALRKAQGKELQYFEWVEMYYYLAESCVRESKKQEAFANYQNALGLVQGRGLELEKTIREKIKAFS